MSPLVALLTLRRDWHNLHHAFSHFGAARVHPAGGWPGLRWLAGSHLLALNPFPERAMGGLASRLIRYRSQGEAVESGDVFARVSATAKSRCRIGRGRLIAGSRRVHPEPTRTQVCQHRRAAWAGAQRRPVAGQASAHRRWAMLSRTAPRRGECGQPYYPAHSCHLSHGCRECRSKQVIVLSGEHGL